MVDKTRASRDGHQFHETWAARRSLELLLPRDDLIAIAVEGLSPVDQRRSVKEAAEIADLVLYYGTGTDFETSKRQEVLQFKYSVANKDSPFVASDAKKTIAKFADTERDYCKRFGDQAVAAGLRYELVTNRPIGQAFAAALMSLASGTKPVGRAALAQAKQVQLAAGLNGDALSNFLRRVTVSGGERTVGQLQGEVARRVVDWSATSDAIAGKRLGDLCRLVRDKAGTAGESNNLIRLVDVLDALGIPDESALLPAPAAFVEVGQVVVRPQLRTFLDVVNGAPRPVLLHAAGGVGKTVFLQSFAREQSVHDEVVLFDCFGGGNYRSIDDARHLARHGLLHIINILATRGLCDPVLPGYGDAGEVVGAARRRFQQALQTLRRARPDARLLILIDAADNAAQQAKDRGDDAFPRLLMESFEFGGLPDGVRLIASCRTERRDLAQGNANAIQFELCPFSLAETGQYLGARVSGCSASDVEVAQARSQGNPRVLDHLVANWSELVQAPESKSPLHVDDLIEARIERALQVARLQGYGPGDVAAFLAGLTVLPPPVPPAEYALAIGFQTSAIESFAADLAPLLDRTAMGLVFRDEPTETVVRRKYGADRGTLQDVAARLALAQQASAYAARALPHLFGVLEDAQGALELAFSDTLPSSVTSDVGKRAIRVARLGEAVRLACSQRRIDDLVRLLVELGTVSASGAKVDEYLSANPELVVGAGDAEALRRLFELRPTWAGARHARLSIAYNLLGDHPEATRHTRRAVDWINWYFQQKDKAGTKERVGPVEAVALPLHMVRLGRMADACRSLAHWRNWFGYEVAQRLCDLSVYGLKISPSDFAKAICAVDSGPPTVFVAMLLGLHGLTVALTKKVIRKLAESCRGMKPERKEYGRHGDQFNEALIHAAAMAVRNGQLVHAREILQVVHFERPRRYIFDDQWYAPGAAAWLLLSATRALASGRAPELLDIAPKECHELLADTSAHTEAEILLALEEAVKARVAAAREARQEKDHPSEDDLHKAVRTFRERVVPLFALCMNVADVMQPRAAKRGSRQEESLGELISMWRRPLGERSYFESPSHTRHVCARELSFSGFQLLRGAGGACVGAFVEALQTTEWLSPDRLIDYIGFFGRDARTVQAALDMNPIALRMLEQQDEPARRAALFALLARAVCPVSEHDSASYFRKGLRQLEALGAGDYEAIWEILPIVSRMKDKRLDDVHAQRLFNLCELNFGGEAEKFPWVDFGRAAAASVGPRALAQLSRWQDRRKASLRYTVPPILAALAQRREVDATDCMSLLMLDDIGETHWFSVGDLLGALSDMDLASAEQLASEMLRQLELEDRSGLGAHSLEALAQAIQPRVSADSPVLLKVQRMLQGALSRREEAVRRSNSSLTTSSDDSLETQETERRNTLLFQEIVASTDATDAAQIASAMKRVREAAGMWSLRADLLAELRTKVPPTAARVKHVEAIVAADGLWLDHRIAALQACVDAWGPTSPSVEELRPDLAGQILLLYTDELLSRDYAFVSSFRALGVLSTKSQTELALQFGKALTQSHLRGAANVWYRLAYLVAEAASPASTHAAISRLLDGDAANLAAGYGDGPFGPELDPGNAWSDIVSGVIWSRLGSPDAFARWRGAHAVRLLAQSRRWQTLDRLVARYPSVDAGAFGGRSLKFLHFHARLWLLIGLARAAKEERLGFRRYIAFLRSICLEPHDRNVVLRAFALQALEAILSPTDAHDVRLLAEVSKVNMSSYQPEAYPHQWGGTYRPKDAPEPEHDFSLDYDFHKYDMDSLGRRFGVPGWQVADRVAAKALSWDPTTTRMYDRGGRDGYGGPYEGESVRGRFTTYGQHLGLHALFAVAGDLLAERPPKVSEWFSDSWEGWLSEQGLTRSDGLWLADGTDAYPEQLDVPGLLTGEGKSLRPTRDLATLTALAGVINGILGDEVVVDADWRASENVTVAISSALVSKRRALKACQEVARADPFQQWLPTLRSHADDSETLNAERSPFEAWIAVPEAEARLDEYDGFASMTAVRRAQPSRSLIALAGLVKQDPFGRSWTDAGGRDVFRSQAWGSRRGYGRNEVVETGQKAFVRTAFLLPHLLEHESQLAVLVKLEQYEKDGDVEGRFNHAGALMLISAEGELKLCLQTNVKMRHHG